MALDDTIKTFDINKELNIFNLRAKQNDTTGARSFTFRLIKNNQIFDLTGLNIKVGGNKADGKQIFNNCKIINASKGLVELELTTQMLAAAGTLNVELIILQGNVRLSTIPFEIEIVPSVTQYSDIVSSDEFGVLTDAINKADEYGEKLKDGTEKIELTYADKLNSLDSQLSDIKKVNYKIDGLNLTINSFKMILKNGEIFSFTEGILNLKDNTTNEIVITLENTPQLHALPRAIHTGCIWLGTATTMNGQTKFNPQIIEFPKTSLPRTKNLLSRFNNVLRVGIIGDSISEGTGGTPFWFDLVFNSNYQENGYNVEYVDNVDLYNYAVGSQTADHSMCMLGTAFNINNPNVSENCVAMGKTYSSKYLDKPALKSEILSKQFDLVLIGIGVNGGSYNAQHLENIVRKLRKNSTEVILITENFRKSDNNYFKDDGLYMKKIADYYGCELCDTWSFMYEKREDNIFADDIHPSVLGQTLWAKAVRSCINKYYQEEFFIKSIIGKRIMNISSDVITKFPTRCDVCFEPISHNGTIKTSDVPDVKNPAVLFGGKTNSNSVIELTAGQKAVFGHSHCCMVSMLYDYISDANFTIKQVGTGNSVTKDCWRLPFHRYGTMEELIGLGVHDNIMEKGNPGMAPRLYEITVNSGTLKLIGMMFYTFDYDELDFEKCNYIGSWNSGEWFNGIPYAKFTDNLNACMTFRFKGNGCMVSLGKCNVGGIIEIYLDGFLYETVDLNNGGVIGLQKFIFPYSNDDIFQEGNDEHIVKIKLKTLNSNSPSGLLHNLTIQNIYIFN